MMECSLRTVLLFAFVSLLVQELVSGHPQANDDQSEGKNSGVGGGEKILQTCPKPEKSLSESAKKSLNDTQHSALEFINKHRSEYDAPALGPDMDLFSNAQKCAEYYADKGVFDKSCPYTDGAGEVVRGCKGGADKWNLFDYSKRAIDKWMDQAKDFDYSKPNLADSTKCFTQLVWKSSKNFGFGCAIKKGVIAAVGLFQPAGNVIGSFLTNVCKPLKLI